MVDYNGTQYRMHANNLRKFNTRVCEIRCESMSIQCESDNIEHVVSVDNLMSCNCAVVYEQDVDFGEIVVIDPSRFKPRVIESLPSHKIAPEKLVHLSPLQRRELLEVLDRYPEVFSEVPGLCTNIEHRIPIRQDFQPKRLKAYKVPEHLKAEVTRQVQELEQLGFIERSTSVDKPITDLTSKRISDRIPFGQRERDAFCMLKLLLCQAANEPLDIVDHTRQLSLFVDASDIAVGAALTQCDNQGRFRPIAFASSKLTPTQQRWSTIEREAYASLWALQKYKYWIFGTRIVLYSDHNPITFLTEATPKSSKLMRWSLALQEFDVEFRFRCGKFNEAADCLSRMIQAKDQSNQPVTE